VTANTIASRPADDRGEGLPSLAPAAYPGCPDRQAR